MQTQPQAPLEKPLFEKFIKEKTYLANVTPRTVQWYRESFKWLGNEHPRAEELKAILFKMRDAGLKPSSCNNRFRAINSYLHWVAAGDAKCGSGCQHLKAPRVKEESSLLPTWNLEDIKKIQRWKPKTREQKRLRAILLTLADTGMRIEECLSLRIGDVDFENRLITVTGKGRRQRKVPMSEGVRQIQS